MSLYDYVNRVVSNLTSPQSTYMSVTAKRPTVVEDLAVGEVQLEVPTAVRDVIGHAAQASHLGYVDPKGDRDLREAYGAWCEGVDFEGLDVLVTAGAKEALWLVLAAESSPGSELWLPVPGWPPYPLWAGAAELDARAYDPRQLLEDPRGVLAEARHQGGIVLLNYPHNPTGISANQFQLDDVVSAARERDLSLLSDEVYRNFSSFGCPSILKSPAFDAQRDVVVDSTSKALGMAGLRIGFLVTSPDRVRTLKVIRGGIASCVSSITQQVASQLLKSTDSADWLRGMRSAVRSRVFGLGSALRNVGVEVVSSGALYVWVKCDEHKLGADGRIGFYPGAMFGTPGHARLCAARQSIDNERVARAIKDCQ